MNKLVLALLLLLPVAVHAEPVAVDYAVENDAEAGKFTFYSYPKYYKDAQENFQEVNTSVQTSTRLGYDHEIIAGVYKLWIKNDGTFTFRHWDDERTWRLTKLVLRNEDTGKEVVQDIAAVWPTPTVKENTVKWTFANSATYEIKYENDTLVDTFILPESIKNSTKLLIPAAWSGDEITFGLKYDITVEEDGATVEESADKKGGIAFRDNTTSEIIHRIRPGEVDYDNKPTEPTITPNDDDVRRKTISGSNYYDKVPVAALDKNTTKLTFNDSKTFGGRSGADYSGTQDTLMKDTSGDFNYGGNAATMTGLFGGNTYNTLVAFDLKSFYDDVGEVDVSATTLKMQCYSVLSSGGSYHVYPVLRSYGDPTSPWDVDAGASSGAASDGEPTWNNAKHHASSPTDWNTDGCVANSSGVDGDVAGDYDGSDDRGNASLVDSAVDCTSTGEKTWTFNSTGHAVVETQTNNSGIRYGFIIPYPGSGGAAQFRSSSYATAADRPQLEITYTGAAAAQPQVIRVNIQ